MVKVKVTSNFRVTIPKAIRTLLQLKAGDVITFTVKNNKQIEIKKAKRDHIYLKSLESTLEEWSSKNDEEAFKQLI